MCWDTLILLILFYVYLGSKLAVSNSYAYCSLKSMKLIFNTASVNCTCSINFLLNLKSKFLLKAIWFRFRKSSAIFGCKGKERIFKDRLLLLPSLWLSLFNQITESFISHIYFNLCTSYKSGCKVCSLHVYFHMHVCELSLFPIIYVYICMYMTKL